MAEGETEARLPEGSMVDFPEADRRAGPRRMRKFWCLVMGVGCGTFWGGVIGALLGAVALTLAYPEDPAGEALFFGALYGLFPGIPGGFWIGMTAVIRDARWAAAVGTAMGVGVGMISALLVVGGDPGNALLMMVYLVPLGALGGLLLVPLVRAMTARWSWWREGDNQITPVGSDHG